MTTKPIGRRDFLKKAAAGVSAALLPLPAVAQGAGGHVVVVGGGFAGATCARFIKRIDPRGRSYYWATNEPPPKIEGHETDLTALAKGFITLTPLQYNMTRHTVLAEMEQTWRLVVEE